MTFDYEGITRVVFSDRSSRRGMVFAVDLPIDAVAATSSARGADPVAELAAVPLPAGMPLILGALAALSLVARRRRAA